MMDDEDNEVEFNFKDLGDKKEQKEEHIPKYRNDKNAEKDYAKIIKATGLSEKEIDEMVWKKKQELKGLINTEGALFLIGKELGVDLKMSDEPTMSMDDDTPKEGDQEVLEIGTNGVRIKIFIEGNWIYDSYNSLGSCMICNEKNRFVSGHNGTCIVCDDIMNEKEYQKHFGKSVEILSMDAEPDLIMKNPKEGDVLYVEETMDAEDIDSTEEYIEETMKKEKEAEIVEMSMDAEEVEETMEVEQEETTFTIGKKQEIVKEIPKNKPKYELAKPTDHSNLLNLPSIDEVDYFLEMYNHVKFKIVDKSDFHTYKRGSPPRMKKSGWRKFIKPFNLSVELIREAELGKENPRVYELGIGPDGNPDIHAEVHLRVFVKSVKVKCPSCGDVIQTEGQMIESVGYKSKSEYWSSKYSNFGSYDLHNLITTARTRAENIGISDLVGFGEVSAEEIKGQSDDSESDTGMSM